MELQIKEKISSLLSQPFVEVGRLDDVLEKILAFHESANESLHVVADFDFTLTSCHNGTTKGGSTFCALESHPQLSNSFREKLNVLRGRYAPIDADPSIGKEEKKRLVTEWNDNAIQLYISEKLTKQTINNAIRKANIQFRDGIKDLLDILKTEGVPTLILSAGLGDTIDSMLSEQNIFHDNVTVLSNYLTFDEHSLISGISKPLITTATKVDVGEMFPAYFESAQKRSNLILLGDRIEDLNAGLCFKGIDRTLSIGFLNEKADTQLKLYKEKYDIVLLGDPDLTLVIDILRIVI